MWVKVERKNYLCNLQIAFKARLFDELFNFVLQTIYLRGAPKAPTVCFRNRCLGNYTIRREAGRECWRGEGGSSHWHWLKQVERHRAAEQNWDLPNAFGLTSSLVKELSPSSSSSDTSTSSSCRPFFGSQVILFSFFNLLLALANQQLTWDNEKL